MLVLFALIGLILVVFAAFIVANLANWLHWIVGSPTANGSYQVEIDSTTIFSFYGRWVANKFIQRQIQNRTKAVNIAEKIVQNEQIPELEKAVRINEIANNIHYLNPFSGLGMCIYCFSINVSTIAQLVFWVAFYCSFGWIIPIIIPIAIFTFFWSLVLFFLNKFIL